MNGGSTQRSGKDGRSHVLVDADVHEELRRLSYERREPIADIATRFIRAGIALDAPPPQRRRRRVVAAS